MKAVMAAGAAAAALGLVSACTSGPKSTTPASPPASRSATPSMTASASPSPSTAPPAAGRVLVASGSYVAETGEAGGELFARLKGGTAYPAVSGWSEYDQEGGFRELDVFLNNAGGLAGRQVSVSVRGITVGAITVSGAGQGFGEWDTEHGQNVPAVTAGATVLVKTR